MTNKEFDEKLIKDLEESLVPVLERIEKLPK